MNQYRPSMTSQVTRLIAERNAQKVCGEGHTFTQGSICPVCLANYLDKGGSLD